MGGPQLWKKHFVWYSVNSQNEMNTANDREHLRVDVTLKEVFHVRILIWGLFARVKHVKTSSWRVAPGYQFNVGRHSLNHESVGRRGKYGGQPGVYRKDPGGIELNPKNLVCWQRAPGFDPALITQSLAPLHYTPRWCVLIEHSCWHRIGRSVRILVSG